MLLPFTLISPVNVSASTHWILPSSFASSPAIANNAALKLSSGIFTVQDERKLAFASLFVQLVVDQVGSSTSIQGRSGLPVALNVFISVLFPFFTFKLVNELLEQLKLASDEFDETSKLVSLLSLQSRL